MDKTNDYLLIFIVLIGFCVGYLLLSFIVKKIKAQLGRTEEDNKGRGSNNQHQNSSSYRSSKEKQEENYSENSEKQDDYSKSHRPNLERDYLELLNLKPGASIEDIKKNYRNVLSKYHPDKVTHLGLEFQKMAGEKTKAIIKAYEYFKNKYNIN